MIDIIRRLFCVHKWKEISGEIRIWSRGHKHPIGYERVYICEKCLKKRIIKY